jgi:hypothetical protein
MKLSSQNSKILVFSDVHEDVEKLEKIIKSEAADINLCLGDWCDSLVYNSVRDIQKTSRFLVDFLSQPNNFSLVGNHDLARLYPSNRWAGCSGYEFWKVVAMKDVLSEQEFSFIKEKMLWHIWVDDWFCSHAGIHPSFIPESGLELSNFPNWILSQCENAQTALEAGKNHRMFAAGRGRGGMQRVGGITWLDFDREFKEIPWLKQIFGHTNGADVRKSGTNYCIDCFLSEYLVISNEKIEIKKFRIYENC